MCGAAGMCWAFAVATRCSAARCAIRMRSRAKTLALTRAVHRDSGAAVEGYEIHMGQTAGPDCGRGWLEVAGRIEGAANGSGRVMGTYLHGIFTSDAFRRAFLGGLGAKGSDLAYDEGVEATLDALAAHVEAHLDVEMILGLAR